jgi:hypothetical protein
MSQLLRDSRLLLLEPLTISSRRIEHYLYNVLQKQVVPATEKNAPPRLW